MKILADKIIASKRFRTNVVRDTPRQIAPDVRMARKYVLENHATALMTELANAKPADMKRMIQVGWPAEEALWFEFPTKVVIDTREKLHPGWKESLGFDVKKEVGDLTGFIVKKNGDSWQMMVIEACKSFLQIDDIFVWPVGYVLYKEPQPDVPGYEINDRVYIEKAWGYNANSKGVKALGGHVSLTMHKDMLEKKYHELLAAALAELQGCLRLAVAAMSMLNTVAEPTERVNGPRFISGGRTHPASAYYPLVISVPKRHTARPIGYITNQIAQHHRRLHEVRGHWRHVKRQPRTDGWQEIEINGVTYWRKAIQAHYRGDPELGIVEHTKRFVR